MQIRNLKLLKWLASTPAIAACTQCQRRFSVPLPLRGRVSDAQESLRKQFAEHQCVGKTEERRD